MENDLYDNYDCELLSGEKVEHDLSFKIVVIGNTGKYIFNIKIRRGKIQYYESSRAEDLR